MSPTVAVGGVGVIVALVLAAGIAVQTVRLADARVTLSQERSHRATEVANATAAAASAVQAYRDLEAATRARQQENERAQLEAMERGRADGVRAGTADARLWKRYADAVAASCSRTAADSTALAASAAGEAARVLADVPRRVGEAARRYADIAESAIIRGERCSADYDALTQGAKTSRGPGTE